MPSIRMKAKAVTFPLVGPDAAWNGTPLSGGTPPSDPVRTTAKPACQWWQPSENRMSGNLTIGVDADALGGVAYVDFWVEGRTQRTYQTINRSPDVNGRSRARLGYWITLDSAAFNAVSTTGEARIFATAVANDVTMQNRVIGYPLVGNINTGHNGDRVMSIFPRTTASDFAKTVGPSGADYTTLDLAIVAAKAALAEAAEFTIIATGTYELSTVGTARYTGAKGFHVIKAAPGVTATIGRAAFPSGANTTWPIEPMFDGLEFQGSGIVIDWRNMSTIQTNAATKPNRFNGCTHTNSIGLRDTDYWNKGVGPGRQFGIPGYVEDCQLEFIGETLISQLMATGNRATDVGGRVFTATHFVANNFIDNVSPVFWRTPLPAMTLAYSGGAAATISKTGSSDSGSLVLKENGVTIATYVLGKIASDTWYNVSDIVANINATYPGWTAVLTGDTRRASALLGSGFGDANGFTDIAVTSTPRTLVAWFDLHTDLYQFYTTSAYTLYRENVIWRGGEVINMSTDALAGIQVVFADSKLKDVIIDSVSSHGGDSSSLTLEYNHLVIRNCNFPQAWNYYSAGISGTYSQIEQSVCGNNVYQTGADFPTSITFKDNYLVQGYKGTGNLNTLPNSGNVIGAFLSNPLLQFVSPSTGDFRPADALLTNLKTKVSNYDGLLNARLVTDAIGAWKIGLSAPGNLF